MSENEKDFKSFKIGHSSAKSETFFPTHMSDDENELVYLDIAGLNDTDGPMADLVNSFLFKMLFEYLNKVKILVPISVNQLKN